jgi:hypothetical protein
MGVHNPSGPKSRDHTMSLCQNIFPDIALATLTWVRLPGSMTLVPLVYIRVIKAMKITTQ